MPIENILLNVVSKEDIILTANQAQKKYGIGTEGFKRNISAAIVINTISSIPNILQKANELNGTGDQFTLYPISSGNNWGYGSGLPASDLKPAVILDLSNLNKITYFNPETGIVTVQPGVTQKVLREFLDKECASHYMVPVTGAGPDCSILGNALERGYGITPYTDHFAAVNSLKAYLPDGRLYQSALCELDQSGTEIVGKCFKWGVGPYLDGLFTQSGYGIVTEISLKLKIRPEGFDSFYIRFRKDEDSGKAVGLIADILKTYEGIVGSINLMDKRRILSMVANNPNGPETRQIMSDGQLERLSKEHDVPAWMVAGSIYGTPKVVAAVRSDIKKRARGLACQTFFSSGFLIKAGRWLTNKMPGHLLSRERNMIKTMDMGIDIMRGIPNQVALPLSYWRTAKPTKKDRTLNPAEDGCGLLWYVPLVPMDKNRVSIFVNMVREICPRHNIEPMITFTNFCHHCADSTIPILFNLRDPKALEDARECLDELVAEGLKQGFVSYRLNIDQQQKMLNKQSVFWDLVYRIGQTIDSNSVVSMGRYGHWV